MKSDAEAVEVATNAIFAVIEETRGKGLVVAGSALRGDTYIIDRGPAMFIVNQLTDLSIDPEEITVEVVRAVFTARDPSDGVINIADLQRRRPYPGRDIHGVPTRWWKVVNAIDKRLMATVRIKAEYPEDRYRHPEDFKK